MADRVYRVALTGGIATGKSHCLKRFALLGVPVIDADALAHDAVAPGMPAHDAIVRRFGSAVVGKADAIDRGALARLVFADAAARRDLEGIIHPLVFRAIAAWFEDLGAQAAPPALAIADIPLLYETDHAADFDCVVVAACDEAEQVRRLMQRNHLSEADAHQRIAAQMPIETKARQADYVVNTAGSIDSTDRQVVEVYERLRAVATRASTRPR